MSRLITVRLVAGEMFSFSIAASFSSSSTATTHPAAAASSRVRTPSPGPISITISSCDSSAASMVLSRTLAVDEKMLGESLAGVEAVAAQNAACFGVK